MNCADFESILADYLDGTLPAVERVSLEEHAATCPACREFMAEVSGGFQFLTRSDTVEPPAELITRIAYLTPRGRTQDPFERQGFLSRLKHRWLLPVLQPRLAMSMAMTILSFAMLMRCTGVQVQRIRPADLSPLRVWGGAEDKALRVKDQVVKYYENLRIVYEVETHLKDLQEPATVPAAQSAHNPSTRLNKSGATKPGDKP
jgi:anti-sigma factor RsiW